jgi:hypothetical protein
MVWRVQASEAAAAWCCSAACRPHVKSQRVCRPLEPTFKAPVVLRYVQPQQKRHHSTVHERQIVRQCKRASCIHVLQQPGQLRLQHRRCCCLARCILQHKSTKQQQQQQGTDDVNQ